MVRHRFLEHGHHAEAGGSFFYLRVVHTGYQKCWNASHRVQTIERLHPAPSYAAYSDRRSGRQAAQTARATGNQYRTDRSRTDIPLFPVIHRAHPRHHCRHRSRRRRSHCPDPLPGPPTLLWNTAARRHLPEPSGPGNPLLKRKARHHLLLLEPHHTLQLSAAANRPSLRKVGLFACRHSHPPPNQATQLSAFWQSQRETTSSAANFDRNLVLSAASDILQRLAGRTSALPILRVIELSENIKLRFDQQSGQNQQGTTGSLQTPNPHADDTGQAAEAESQMRRALGLLGEGTRHRQDPERVDQSGRGPDRFNGGLHRRRSYKMATYPLPSCAGNQGMRRRPIAWQQPSPHHPPADCSGPKQPWPAKPPHGSAPNGHWPKYKPRHATCKPRSAMPNSRKMRRSRRCAVNARRSLTCVPRSRPWANALRRRRPARSRRARGERTSDRSGRRASGPEDAGEDAACRRGPPAMPPTCWSKVYRVIHHQLRVTTPRAPSCCR